MKLLLQPVLGVPQYLNGHSLQFFPPLLSIQLHWPVFWSQCVEFAKVPVVSQLHDKHPLPPSNFQWSAAHSSHFLPITFGKQLQMPVSASQLLAELPSVPWILQLQAFFKIKIV